MSDDEPTPIESALDSLSAAASPSELAQAHRALARKVRQSRREQSRQWGPLATAYGEMMAMSDQLKAEGVSREDRAKGIEAVLRQVWPFSREWKYLCEKCNDTGLVMHLCRPGDRCNGISTRTDAPHQEPGKFQRLCVTSETYEHEYGVPCLCSLGNRFRERPRSDPSDYTETAGKMKRLGRR